MRFTRNGLWSVLLFISHQVLAQSNQDEQVLPSELIQQSDQAGELDNISTEQLRELIFNDLVEKRSLLSEDQLRRLHQLEQTQINATKRANPPKHIKEIIPISYDPAQTLPRVYVTPGWNSHISIIDQAGKPWKIAYFSNGNQADFKIKHVAVGAQNTLEVESIYGRGSTNLTVLLDGTDDLFSLELVANHDQFHPLATLRIDRFQHIEDAQHQTIQPSTSESLLRAVLQDQVEDESDLKPLISSDPRVKAWVKDNTLYLRTKKLRLRAPNALSIEHGAGSVTAYKAPFLPAVSLTNDNGAHITVTLSFDS